MDDAKTNRHIEQHADAVVRGDMNAIVPDFSEDLRPQVPQLAQALPQPVTEAHMLSVEVGEEDRGGHDPLLGRQRRRHHPVTLARGWGSPRDRPCRGRRLTPDSTRCANRSSIRLRPQQVDR